MDNETARQGIYAMFPKLVLEDKLSVRQALAYGLFGIMGLDGNRTAEIMSDILGKPVSVGIAYRYASRAREKYREAGIAVERSVRGRLFESSPGRMRFP